MSRVEPRTTALSYSWHRFRAKKREKGEVKTTRRKEQTWRNPVMNQRALDLEDHWTTISSQIAGCAAFMSYLGHLECEGLCHQFCEIIIIFLRRNLRY